MHAADINQRKRYLFWAKVRKDHSGCWIWTASVNNMGYGQFNTGNTMRLAHRISYYLHHGHCPEGLEVRHKCDKPRCVNPDHLELGEHKDNMNDMSIRGRAVTLDKRSKKLKNSDAVFILQSEAQSNELATMFNVSETCINRIRRGTSWKTLRCDNLSEATKKIRSLVGSGPGSNTRKLDVSQVISIRSDYRSADAIARDYGLKPGTVSDIKRRKTWKHV